MADRSAAEEHLRVIRSLMERSTIYRAISVPTAVVGFLSAVATAFWKLFDHHSDGTMLMEPRQPVLAFILSWCVALLITGSANTHFLWRGSQRRGEPFLSSGMKLAAKALLPPFLCAAVITVGFIRCSFTNSAYLPLLAATWAMFYGLGLLGTGHFAPRSIRVLGWAFVVGGLAYLLQRLAPEQLSGAGEPFESWVSANVFMFASFGLFHLVYAVCTWPRRAALEATDEPVS